MTSSEPSMRTLLILKSYHHKNTEKIAEAMATVLDAPILSPHDVRIEEIARNDLIGFGSGIYDGKHHRALLELADRLPATTGKSVFLFSTSAIVNDEKVAKDHSALREMLQRKGYVIVDEFACKGFNTNSFLRYFGGLNKGRPNVKDLAKAEEFARGLRRNMSGQNIQSEPLPNIRQG
ncbi:MAG: flavodoxin family protein [Methanomassiliicoccales archaeon]